MTASVSKACTLASMGPHFFKCGKGCRAPRLPQKPGALQWGRTFSSAERFSCRGRNSVLRRASMGPHFFKCGKSIDQKNKLRVRARFNGAALFQVRKVCVTATCDKAVTLASMGPHFFKCGKNVVAGFCLHVFYQLQWGRTFSSAESERCVRERQPKSR